MSKIKAIASSIGGAMIFGSYTLIPVMVLMWVFGIIEVNI